MSKTWLLEREAIIEEDTDKFILSVEHDIVCADAELHCWCVVIKLSSNDKEVY